MAEEPEENGEQSGQIERQGQMNQFSQLLLLCPNSKRSDIEEG
jgi:hypothetical protein